MIIDFADVIARHKQKEPAKTHGLFQEDRKRLDRSVESAGKIRGQRDMEPVHQRKSGVAYQAELEDIPFG